MEGNEEGKRRRWAGPRAWLLLVLVIATLPLALWWAEWRGSVDAPAGAAVEHAGAPSIPAASSAARVVDEPREDIWNDLRPDTQDMVLTRLGVSDGASGEVAPAEEAIPGKGVMTRLPDRYRPVMVGQVTDDGLVVGEVMNIPPDTRTDDAGAEPPDPDGARR